MLIDQHNINGHAIYHAAQHLRIHTMSQKGGGDNMSTKAIREAKLKED